MRTMTNQDAINILKIFKRTLNNRDVYQAISLAMQALAMTNNTSITDIESKEGLKP